MKKLLLVLPIVALLAAGCGSSTQPTVQQAPPSQNQQPVVKNPTPTPTPKPTLTPSPIPTPTPTPVCEYASPPPGCSWQGGKPYPACGATLVCPNPTPTPTPQPTSASINISNFAFSPAAITVKKGTKVTWTNQDGASHTVTGDNGGPASGTLANGASYSFTFTQTGIFSYHCAIHPSMTASVTVTQ
jgi:plastocyanin